MKSARAARADKTKIEAGLRKVRPKQCLLCGGSPPAMACLFTPHRGANQRRVGAPPGKLRIIAYALCRPCSQLPTVNDLVEARIFADCARAAARPPNVCQAQTIALAPADAAAGLAAAFLGDPLRN